MTDKIDTFVLFAVLAVVLFIHAHVLDGYGARLTNIEMSGDPGKCFPNVLWDNHVNRP